MKILTRIMYRYAAIVFFAPSELLPANGRTIGSSLILTMEPIVLYIVVKILPTLYSWLGMSYLFIIYSGITATFLTVVFIFMPETYGLSLEQIEELFR